MDDTALREVGLKITSPRVKILKIFEQSENRHMSAEEVYQALQRSGDDVGLATVYRVLTQFQEAGLLHRHNFEGNSAVFELDNVAHHDHVVCERCNYVEEFVDDIIEERQASIAAKMGFKMTDHSLTIHGICGKCLETANA